MPQTPDAFYVSRFGRTEDSSAGSGEPRGRGERRGEHLALVHGPREAASPLRLEPFQADAEPVATHRRRGNAPSEGIHHYPVR